jgi:hypothetical protein
MDNKEPNPYEWLYEVLLLQFQQYKRTARCEIWTVAAIGLIVGFQVGVLVITVLNALATMR